MESLSHDLANGPVVSHRIEQYSRLDHKARRAKAEWKNGRRDRRPQFTMFGILAFNAGTRTRIPITNFRDPRRRVRGRKDEPNPRACRCRGPLTAADRRQHDDRYRRGDPAFCPRQIRGEPMLLTSPRSRVPSPKWVARSPFSKTSSLCSLCLHFVSFVLNPDWSRSNDDF